MASESFFHQLFGSIADGGRVLIDRQLRGLARQPGRAVTDLCHALLSQRGEASGAALAREVLLAYGELDAAGRTAFFQHLADEFERRCGRDRARRRCLSQGAWTRRA